MKSDRRKKIPRIITVSASSKKAGKSTAAAYLIKHLGVPFGLKVSSGDHAPSIIVTDLETLSRAGTDTGAMIEAGAEKVVWVNSPGSRLGREIKRAVAMFPKEGTMVVEGNSATVHLDQDFAVFVMGVPFDRFKPSAWPALARADMVLVDMRFDLNAENPRTIASELARKAPGARAVFFYDEEGQVEALEDTVKLIRR